MKFKLMLASLVGASMLLADVVVNPSFLPQSAKDFIKSYFPNTNIGFVKQDVDSFDVTLADGTEIDFIINGDWKEIDGKYKAIPTNFLSNDIISKVKNTHPNASIIKVEKKVNGYEFKLNNMMEVYTDFNGNILGQKFDD